MSSNNPTNPASSAIANMEAIINRMKPMDIQPKSESRGLLSKTTPTVQEAKEDIKERVAHYIMAIRKVRESMKETV